MMKRKKIISCLVALSIITAVSFPSINVQAATTSTVTNNITSNSTGKGTSVKVSKDKLNKIDSVFHPDNTVRGAGGSATVNSYRGSVYWKVKPDTDWPYKFKGTLEVDFYDGETQYYNLSGYGALGSSVSDTVDLGRTGGYSVYLNGEAYSLDGYEYTVLPGCEGGSGI